MEVQPRRPLSRLRVSGAPAAQLCAQTCSRRERTLSQKEHVTQVGTQTLLRTQQATHVIAKQKEVPYGQCPGNRTPGSLKARCLVLRHDIQTPLLFPSLFSASLLTRANAPLPLLPFRGAPSPQDGRLRRTQLSQLSQPVQLLCRLQGQPSGQPPEVTLASFLGGTAPRPPPSAPADAVCLGAPGDGEGAGPAPKLDARSAGAEGSPPGARPRVSGLVTGTSVSGDAGSWGERDLEPRSRCRSRCWALTAMEAHGRHH